MRDIDTIDSELRLVAALRRAARDRGGPLPSIAVADALLDERHELMSGYNPQAPRVRDKPSRGSVSAVRGNEQECATMQPGSSHGDSTRANDADRADVCAILDNAYADGELDADEHRQRCSSAMSAKTRSQLLDMVSDLQARPPAFSRQPAIAVKVSPNRKWIVGATVGAGVAALAILGFIIATWHSGSSPSPTAPAAAPAAPVAAPTDTHSSETTGTYFPLADLVAMVSGDFQDQIGHAPEHVNCPGDLAGHVGAFERCSITDNGKRYTADVTVTAVNGNRISTSDSIDEVGSPPPPPSRP